MKQTDTPPELELAETDAAEESGPPPKGLWRETLERLLRKPSAIVGLVILSFLVLVAIFAPVIATHEPLDTMMKISEEGAHKRMDPCIHLLGCPDAGDELLHITTDAPIMAMGLNSTNSQVVTASGNTIVAWDVESGDKLMEFDHPEPVTSAVWSPTDQYIIASSGDMLYVWDVNRRNLRKSFTNRAGAADSMLWVGEGFLVTTANSVNAWALADTGGGEEEIVDDADDTVAAAAGDDTAPADDAGTGDDAGDDVGDAIRIEEQKLEWTHLQRVELQNDLISADWDIHGKRIWIASGNEVLAWKVSSTSSEQMSMSLSGFGDDDDDDSASGGGPELKPVVVPGRENGKAVVHDQPITGVAFSKERSRILTISDNKLYMWDATETTYPQLGETIEPPAEYTALLANGEWIEMLTGVRYVAASSGDTALVWDANSGQLLYTLPHGEPIQDIVSSPWATMVFTRGAKTIKVWNVDDGSEQLTIETGAVVDNAIWERNSGGAVVLTTGNELRMVKTSPYEYIMGVDGNVRDQFSRLIYGTRVSLMVGIATVGFAAIIGTVLGSVAGFVSGWADNLIMRIMDVVLAFPSLILAIAVVTVLGPGLINALLAISVVFIPHYARVARSGVLAVKEEDFVMADRALGVNSVRILFHRVLPNALAPLIVQATLGIGTAILDAAALSFLGLGAQPPTPEWGAMLGAERNQILTAPHLVFFPGVAIMITVLAFNLLGDGLRDALDPRLDR
jgi:ABC-type dipeptide/oligopeptide/nickel transport system permease subunit